MVTAVAVVLACMEAQGGTDKLPVPLLENSTDSASANAHSCVEVATGMKGGSSDSPLQRKGLGPVTRQEGQRTDDCVV